MTLLLFSYADDYSFDVKSFEKKSFELNGFIRTENRHVERDFQQDSYRQNKDEFNLNGFYDKDIFNIKYSFSQHYLIDSDESESHNELINELVQSFGDEKKRLEVGKKILRLGKGYAYSPLAFFERPRDPIYPELSKEGYWMATAMINQTPKSKHFKNYTLTAFYLPHYGDNSTLFTHTNSSWGFKGYLLYKDIDIDILLAQDSQALDFSFNITEAIEVHAEYALKKEIESFLYGVKFQTSSDLTVTFEHYKTYEKEKNLYLNLAQKEPFSIYYFQLYLTTLYNETLDLYSLQSGGIYDFKNGFTMDLAALSSDNAQGIKVLVKYFF